MPISGIQPRSIRRGRFTSLPAPSWHSIKSVGTMQQTGSWLRLRYSPSTWHSPLRNPAQTALVAPEREETWVRRLFEKAVLGFAEVELEPLGWSVHGGVPLHWQVSSARGESPLFFLGW